MIVGGMRVTKGKPHAPHANRPVADSQPNLPPYGGPRWLGQLGGVNPELCPIHSEHDGFGPIRQAEQRGALCERACGLCYCRNSALRQVYATCVDVAAENFKGPIVASIPILLSPRGCS
jgi:hypothetical protein